MRLNPYQLTPLHSEWGWGLRIMEIIGQTLALIFIRPLVLVYLGLEWLMEKMWNS